MEEREGGREKKKSERESLKYCKLVEQKTLNNETDFNGSKGSSKVNYSSFILHIYIHILL